MLVLTGVLSRGGGLDLPLVIAVGVAAAVLGHSVGYGLGRFAAGRLLRRGLGAVLWVGALVLAGYAGGPGLLSLRALLGLA